MITGSATSIRQPSRDRKQLPPPVTQGHCCTLHYITPVTSTSTSYTGTLLYITLHYITLHYTSHLYLHQLHRDIAVHYITLHYTSHLYLHQLHRDIAVHYITLHYVHYITPVTSYYSEQICQKEVPWNVAQYLGAVAGSQK